MIEDISNLPDPDGKADSLLDSIDLIVPHQANKTMVIELAKAAGLTPDQLYFNIEKVGNASSASIPLAIHDAVRDGVIKEPTRIFAPGFGAGAVAGYGILRIDPAVIASDKGVEAPRRGDRTQLRPGHRRHRRLGCGGVRLRLSRRRRGSPEAPKPKAAATAPRRRTPGSTR